MTLTAPFKHSVQKLRDWNREQMNRYYFGNTVEHWANVEGQRRMREARSAGSDAEFDGTLRHAYETLNYSHLNGVDFEPALFESVRRRAVAALDDPAVSPCSWQIGDLAEKSGVPREVLTQDIRRFTTNAADVIPDAAGLLHPGLVHAMRSCVGGNFRLEDIFLTRNYHVAPELADRYELLSDRWHFDDQVTDGFTLFVCLSDVDAACGPFHVVGKADSRALLRKGFSKDLRKTSHTGGLSQDTVYGVPTLARLIGPPGTKLLTHTSFCLHRAGRPEPGRTRDMMMFTFRASREMGLTWPAASA